MERHISTEELRNFLIRRVATELKIDAKHINTANEMTEYGLSSMAATMILADLEDFIGVPLPMTLLWDFPTIDGVVDYIFENEAVFA